MTGISDVFQSAQNALCHSNLALLHLLDWLPQGLAARLRSLFPNALTVTDRLLCPQPRLPDPRPTMRLMHTRDGTNGTAHDVGPTLRWALLLPMTSRGTDSTSFWIRLEKTLRLLGASVSPNLAPSRITELRVAVDLCDPLLDTDYARARLHNLVVNHAPGVQLHFEDPLVPAYEGKLCWIWAHMARSAVASGADYVLLLGDDVELLTPGWQAEVEAEFALIAKRRGLPLGAGCVALRDVSFPAFPTFPVVHRFHLETFDFELFPDVFVNQHGDPFLFELYRRFGLARFAPSATLRNGVGGCEAARYLKQDSAAVWHGEVLERAVEQLEARLAVFNVMRVPCIDVVIPTFRCNIAVLRRLASLSATHASVSTIVVVDRPDTPNLEDLKNELTSYTPDAVTRVFVMPSNQGASMARNAGLSQSFGSLVVFLDDDVEPCEGLLDAYVAAWLRHPDASGFVGITQLPRPKTLLEHAMQACHIGFFYDIAYKLKRPPWGVTANLCVSKRATANQLWFDKRFPKTGGGEDVDFCFRLRSSGSLVSVPDARVLHPFWKRPLQQVGGWATGDVLCLESQPRAAFRAPPNWVELAFGCVLLGRPAEALLAIALELVLLFLSFTPETERLRPWHLRLVTGALAAIPPMIQDAVRLASKLRRGQLGQLCLLFDWMDGQGESDHASATVLTLIIKNMCFALAVAWLHARGTVAWGILGSLLAAILVWACGQRHVLLSTPIIPTDKLQLRTEATPFVVLACQRTGSNHLCGLLHCVPAIAMHNELFNSKGCFSHCGGVPKDLSTRDAHPGALLNDAFDVRGHGYAVGFKLFPEHIRRSDRHHALFLRLLRDPAVKKIILSRESRLAVAVSAVRAQVTGAFTKNPKTGDHDVRVHIKPGDLQRFCESYDDYFAFLEKACVGQRVLRITHEATIANAEDTVQRTCNFLGVQRGQTTLKNMFVQQAVRRVPDERDVANYDELSRVFDFK